MNGLSLDMDKVHELVQQGYISARPHPEYPLFIYNYTPQCQYDWHWTPETIACRGLILDEHDNVIARPFPKFFTHAQYADLRNNVHHLYGLRYKEMYQGKFTVTDKMDGSLGIAYEWNGQIHMASRGSFTSEQAVHGTHMLRTYDFDFWPNRTYLFEIIYPENRIVVDYKGLEDTVLLTVLDNDTGQDCPGLIKDWADNDYPVVQPCTFALFDDVLAHQDDEGEGYVVKFDNGLRVKVKFAEYLRLHSILTHVSARDIWWKLRNKEPLEDFYGLVPDEFYTWIQDLAAELRAQYDSIETHARAVLNKDIVKRNPPLTRKQLAIKYTDYEYKAIMFQMLDNKQYAESIWRLIRPGADKPFVVKDNGP